MYSCKILLLSAALFSCVSFAQPPDDPESCPPIRRVRIGRLPETLTAYGAALCVANEGSNDVDVIMSNPQAAVRSIRVGEGPRMLAVVNGLLYVANHRSDTITVIDPRRDVRVVATINVGQGPWAAAVMGDFIYVTVHYSNHIAVIDTRTLRIEETIEVGRAPQWIVAANGFLFVTALNPESPFVDLVVIEARTNRIVKRFAVALSAHPPLLFGDFLFFENAAEPGLAVLDTRVIDIVATMPMVQGVDVLAARDDTLYLTTRNGADIQVINWRRPYEPRRTLHLDDPAAGMQIYRDFLFVRHANRNEITVLNIAGASDFGRILATIPLESVGMAMTLLGRQLCITLRSGYVVFVDLEELTRAFEVAHPVQEPDLEEGDRAIDGLLGQAGQQTLHPNFMFE